MGNSQQLEENIILDQKMERGSSKRSSQQELKYQEKYKN
jgi:hypothetical protein